MQSDIVHRLRDHGFCCHNDWIDEAADEIERLRAELAAAIKQRDEARREVCDLKSTPRLCAYIPFVTARRYADERGWDCFAQQEGGGA